MLSVLMFPFLMVPVRSLMTRSQLMMRKPVASSHAIMTYTKNQQSYIDALNDQNVALVVVIGSAGTGKTFMGCQWGMNRFLDGSSGGGANINIKRIVITRPLVPVSGEEVGFLPGGMVSKMQPWTRPIYDAFLENNLVNKKMLDKYIVDEDIEIIPLAFMRGRTFTDCFIFADEMQNSTPEQMLMLMTRVGNGSKLVVSGDLAQSDIVSGGENGLANFLEKYRKWIGGGGDDCGDRKMIRVVEFEKADIRRSKITSVVLDLYDNTPL